MSKVTVTLLGRPHVHVDGIEVDPPKGAKAWGLLAYLAAAPRPVHRSELADLLFSEAQDPLGSLRWNLAALRRLLDRPDALKGDRIDLRGADVVVDTTEVDRGLVPAGIEIAPNDDLLSGLSFGDSPLFELWLTAERSRLRRRQLSMGRDATLDALARGDHDLGARLALGLVAAEPFDEGHHALLIRAHVLSGDPAGARQQYERCEALFERELSTRPGPAVHAALVRHAAPASVRPGYDEICARLNVAWQSFQAGAVDYGIEMGRATVALSDDSGVVALRLAGRVFLAAMLSMAARGWDEAATATAEALHLARRSGDAEGHRALAHGIRAGAASMRGDHAAARSHATQGAAASVDPGARALSLTFLGAVEADVGHDDLARWHLEEAVREAELSGDPTRVAYAASYVPTPTCWPGRDDEARLHAAQGLAAAARDPRPQAVADGDARRAHLRSGDPRSAVEQATLADSLAATTGMAYQRALAQRVLGLAAAADGDHEAARDQLTGRSARLAGPEARVSVPLAGGLGARRLGHRHRAGGLRGGRAVVDGSARPRAGDGDAVARVALGASAHRVRRFRAGARR
ncbi:MAG: BTAD domain-containing putative transcriptional regulator [Acidimicrobiales bacterium]